MGCRSKCPSWTSPLLESALLRVQPTDVVNGTLLHILVPRPNLHGDFAAKIHSEEGLNETADHFKAAPVCRRYAGEGAIGIQMVFEYRISNFLDVQFRAEDVAAESGIPGFLAT